LHLDTFEDKRSKERSKDFQKEKKHTRLEREKILRELVVTKKEIQEVVPNEQQSSGITAGTRLQ